MIPETHIGRCPSVGILAFLIINAMTVSLCFKEITFIFSGVCVAGVGGNTICPYDL